MVNEMSKFIYQYNDRILPPIWQLLTQTADIYVKVVVNQSNENPFGNSTGEIYTLSISIYLTGGFRIYVYFYLETLSTASLSSTLVTKYFINGRTSFLLKYLSS